MRNVRLIDMYALSVKALLFLYVLFFITYLPPLTPSRSDITSSNSASLFHVSYLHPTRSLDMNKTCAFCNSKAKLI